VYRLTYINGLDRNHKALLRKKEALKLKNKEEKEKNPFYFIRSVRFLQFYNDSFRFVKKKVVPEGKQCVKKVAYLTINERLVKITISFSYDCCAGSSHK